MVDNVIQPVHLAVSSHRLNMGNNGSHFGLKKTTNAHHVLVESVACCPCNCAGCNRNYGMELQRPTPNSTKGKL